MTDPKRPDEDTQEFEAVDETADATAEDEGEAIEQLESDDELHEDELDEDELQADDDLDDDELATKALPRADLAAAAGAAGAKTAASRGRQTRTATPAPAIDELPYVDDRVSKIWVGLIVAVFAAIFIYGLLLGRGGILTTTPSPEPTASRPPSSSPSTVPSPSVRPSVTAGPSGSVSPSVVVSPTPSRAPSPTAPSSVVPSPT